MHGDVNRFGSDQQRINQSLRGQRIKQAMIVGNNHSILLQLGKLTAIQREHVTKCIPIQAGVQPIQRRDRIRNGKYSSVGRLLRGYHPSTGGW